MNKDFYKVISMMSGTSMDGVDACLIKISDEYEYEIISFYSLEYPKELKSKLTDAALGRAKTEDICLLNFIVGEHFARCANILLKQSNLIPKEVDFISSHGQTVFHIPKQTDYCGRRLSATLQIGDISVISENTGILTIGDYRPKDMAAGGQGAPLVPFADEIIFGKEVSRAIQNIGGISNVTVISPDICTFAFDNTVGNMLIDYYANKFFNVSCDKDGKLAKQGSTDEKWLNYLMSDEYLNLEPPKTTGREHFNDEYADNILEKAPENKYDIMRTITEFTAKSIYDSYKRFIFPRVIPQEVVIGGGGAYNPVLMQSLKEQFGNIAVKTHEDYGISNKMKECLAFGIIGLAAYLKRPNNLPKCTGAQRSVIMGKFAYPN